MRSTNVILAAMVTAVAHTFVAPRSRAQPSALRRPSEAGGGSDATTTRIQTMVDENKVMLFMKGTKIFPQCGFSNMAVQILNAIGADFGTSAVRRRSRDVPGTARAPRLSDRRFLRRCDVLADENVRSEIKVFSDWPTIPQLYVDGDFVGGSDIMLEMYEAGELQEMVEVAAAS